MIVYETPEAARGNTAEAQPRQEPETKSTEKARRTKKKKRRTFGLLPLQATVCALILALLLLVKTFLPDVYGAVRALYDREMARSILITADDV